MKQLLIILFLLCTVSVFATDYLAEAEYYQKKAEGYRREAEYYQKKAKGYEREAEYWLNKPMKKPRCTSDGQRNENRNDNIMSNARKVIKIFAYVPFIPLQ